MQLYFLTSVCFLWMIRSSFSVENRHNIIRRSKKIGIDTFLEKFGYLDDLEEGSDVGHAPEARSSAIREFQRFNGLRATGILDKRTIKKMRAPRCGLPDVIKPKDRLNSGQRLSGKNRNRRPNQQTPVAFYAPGYKWDKKRITWKIMNWRRNLGGESQRRAFINAFRKWSDVIPLKIDEDPRGSKVDIEISFSRREHGDGRGNSFDGRGGTLAHAFFPGKSPISGDTHFDDDEDYTLGVNRGTNLEIVAAHEFGHALGMGHTNVQTALMAPYYQGYNATYGLHRDDIRGIQSLYGRRSSYPTRRPTQPPTTTKRPRTTRKPGTKPRRRRCQLRFDAMLRAHNGKEYVFIGRYIYEVGSRPTGIIWASKKRIRSVFPMAPMKSIGAATHHYGKTFLFKGRQVWKYDGFSLMSGYPKSLTHDSYIAPQAAISKPDGIYLFKKKNYTFWREDLRQPPSGYPVPIKIRWKGVFKANINAAINHKDGYFYFFKGSKYVKVRNYDALPGYPKPKANAWMPGCGKRAAPYSRLSKT